MSKTEGLRKGYTTGTCAAAGTKAAAQALFASMLLKRAFRPKAVSVTLPRGGTLDIPVKSIEVRGNSARAVIIKDAGDDPDVTDGAEFVVDVEVIGLKAQRLGMTVKGGKGVGVVTKPGLKVRAGKPAINPVPMSMIRRSLREAAKEAGITPKAVVTVSVPEGQELAKRTMNPRLGIIGGISILGTTGIVEPMSLAAYTHSIKIAVDVALAAGLKEVVYSTGRSSEKVVEDELKFPPEAFVLTGDHMGYALKDASKRKGLKRVTVAGQFGKFTKLAAGRFETHCEDASVEFGFLSKLCKKAGAPPEFLEKVSKANTAREVFFMLKEKGLQKVFDDIVKLVRKNSSAIAGKGIKVRAFLVGYNNGIAAKA